MLRKGMTKQQKLTERVIFRVSENEKQVIIYFADLESKKISTFVRDSIFEKIERMVKDVETSVHILE